MKGRNPKHEETMKQWIEEKYATEEQEAEI